MAVISPTETLIGTQAPQFTLTGIDGQLYRLADYRGQFVVMHFGTSW